MINFIRSDNMIITDEAVLKMKESVKRMENAARLTGGVGKLSKNVSNDFKLADSIKKSGGNSEDS